MTYSPAVRRRIVELYRKGWVTEDIAVTLAASESGVRRVWQRFRETGSCAAKPPSNGNVPKLDPALRDTLLREIVSGSSDRYCREVADELHRRTAVRVCRQTVGRWLAKLSLTRKKSRCTRPSRNANGSPPSGRRGVTG